MCRFRYLFRCLKNRRGQSAVIGGIIIASLVFSILLPLILLYQRTAEYTSSQAIVELNFLNEKLRESLSVRGSEDASTITVNNTGSTTVTLTRLWLIREGRVERIVELKPNDIISGLTVDGGSTGGSLPTLKPGSTLKISLKNLENPSQLYFYIESDRGVLHPREKAMPLIPPKTEIEETIRREIIEYLAETQFGPMTFWFYSFTYYNVTAKGNDLYLVNYPDGGLPGFEVPSGRLIAFAINVTNYDPRGRSLFITRDSYMKLYHEQLGFTNTFYIKKVDSATRKVLDFDGLNVTHGETVRLIFVIDKNTPQKGSGYVTLVIQGRFSDGTPLTQNIPSVGIRVV